MKFITGLLKALRVGIEGAAAVVLGALLGFFQGPVPTDVNATVWLGISAVAVLAINFALGQLPKPAKKP